MQTARTSPPCGVAGVTNSRRAAPKTIKDRANCRQSPSSIRLSGKYRPRSFFRLAVKPPLALCRSPSLNAMAFTGCSNVFRSPRHHLHGIVGQGRCSAFAWSHGVRRRRGPPSVVRITGTLMVVVQCKPAGVNRRVVRRTSLSTPDPVAAGLLPVPVVEAGAMTISATAGLSGSISTTQAGSLTKSSCPGASQW